MDCGVPGLAFDLGIFFHLSLFGTRDLRGPWLALSGSFHFSFHRTSGSEAWTEEDQIHAFVG